MQQREEKESNEAEDDRRSDDDADIGEEEDEDSEGATLVWQEGYGEDNLGLPIMHWEALSLRIAELEKQEEEKKEKKAKVRGHNLGEEHDVKSQAGKSQFHCLSNRACTGESTSHLQDLMYRDLFQKAGLKKIFSLLTRS